MSDQIIAQCMDCGIKEELTERFTPGTVKCSECGGPLTQYTSRMLSLEELARYGPAKPTKKILNFTKDTIKRDMPIEVKPIEEELSMNTQPKDGTPVTVFIPNKVEVLKGIVAGKSLGKMEREWSMKVNTLTYHMGKWGWKGMKPDRAQQLLDEMAIDKVIPLAQPRGLGAINEVHREEMVKIDPPTAKVVVDEPIVEDDSVVTKDQEIDRLRNELADVIGQRNQIEERGNNLHELAKGELDAWAQKYEQLSEELQVIVQERDDYYNQLTEAEHVLPTPQNMREFHVVVDGIGGVVGGELGALSRYIGGFNHEFHLEVHLYEIAPVEAI